VHGDLAMDNHKLGHQNDLDHILIRLNYKHYILQDDNDQGIS
jgi:hypothetical protein